MKYISFTKSSKSSKNFTLSAHLNLQVPYYKCSVSTRGIWLLSRSILVAGRTEGLKLGFWHQTDLALPFISWVNFGKSLTPLSLHFFNRERS